MQILSCQSRWFKRSARAAKMATKKSKSKGIYAMFSIKEDDSYLEILETLPVLWDTTHDDNATYHLRREAHAELYRQFRAKGHNRTGQF